MLSKIKLMLPTSVLSSLLGEVKSDVVLGGKKKPTFCDSVLKEPVVGSHVVPTWNLTEMIFMGQ